MTRRHVYRWLILIACWLAFIVALVVVYGQPAAVGWALFVGVAIGAGVPWLWRKTKGPPPFRANARRERPFPRTGRGA